MHSLKLLIIHENHITSMFKKIITLNTIKQFKSIYRVKLSYYSNMR